MTTPTTRMGIAKPTTADPFSTSGIAANYDLLDNFPGVRICTLATRPTWGASQEGMFIYETDTELIWQWSGSAWVREMPKGRIGNTSSTSNPTTTTTVSLDSLALTVPSGGRPVSMCFSWSDVSGNPGEIELRRDAVVLSTFQIAVGVGGTFIEPDAGDGIGGAQTFSAHLNAIGALTVGLVGKYSLAVYEH